MNKIDILMNKIDILMFKCDQCRRGEQYNFYRNNDYIFNNELNMYMILKNIDEIDLNKLIEQTKDEHYVNLLQYQIIIDFISKNIQSVKIETKIFNDNTYYSFKIMQ